jgi:hypothetical protein
MGNVTSSSARNADFREHFFSSFQYRNANLRIFFSKVNSSKKTGGTTTHNQDIIHLRNLSGKLQKINISRKAAESQINSISERQEN